MRSLNAFRSIFTVTFCALFSSGCVSTPVDPGRQHEESPEVRAHLVSSMLPVTHVSKGLIAEYAASGNPSKVHLAKSLYFKYPYIRKQVREMFTPDWVVKRVNSLSACSTLRLSDMEADLKYYSVYATLEQISTAKMYMKNAKETCSEKFYQSAPLTVSDLVSPKKRERSTFQVGDAQMLIEVNKPKLFKFSNEDLFIDEELIWSIYKLENSSRTYPKKGFFIINGVPKKFTSKIKGRNAVGAKIVYGSTFRIQKSGKLKIEVKLGNTRRQIDVDVKDIGIKKGAKVDTLISRGGFPDSEKKYYVSWPCSRKVNEFFYSPTATQSILTPEHWMYKKYPNVVFEIFDGTITGIKTINTDVLNTSSTDSSC